MRVLYVADNTRDPQAGAAACDLQLLEALRERGVEVDEVWGLQESRLVSHWNLHYLLEAPWQCRRVVMRHHARRQPDVVMVNQPLGYLAAEALRRCRSAAVFVGRSHGWEPQVRTQSSTFVARGERWRPRRLLSAGLWRALRRQNDRLARTADGLVVCSADDSEFIQRIHGVPLTRLLALRPGVPAIFREKSPAPLDVSRLSRILYVGQFAPIKAPDVVAGAATRILRGESSGTMTWVCARRHHEAVTAMLPADVRPRVTLLDWMSREALCSVYDGHGIYLFPSYYEGFAQTFLEAMARRLIVLATRVDGMRQTIEDGRNGFLFERGDVEQIAARALRLIREPHAAPAIMDRARSTACEFTWSRAGAEVEDFFRQLIELRRRTDESERRPRESSASGRPRAVEERFGSEGDGRRVWRAWRA